MSAKTYLPKRGEQRQNYTLPVTAALLILLGISPSVSASAVVASRSAGSSVGLSEQDQERQRAKVRPQQKETITSTPASCPSPSFDPPTFFGVGSAPAVAAAGDLNRDGNPDLAVSNMGSNNVSVLLGNGTGGFGVATNFAVGHEPHFVAMGDFNRDGNPDLATANAISDDVSVLLGNGAGGFGTATSFGVGDSPSSVAVGDFNRDGDPDLAVTNDSDGNVSVLLGNGNGGFDAPTNFGVGDGIFSATVEDFNRDGGPDLAVVKDESDQVAMLLNTCACAIGPDYQVTSTTNATMLPANNYVAGSGCSNCTVPIALPFAYRLYDQIFNSVNISSEGNLQFVSNSAGGNNVCLPTDQLNHTIMPYWDDLDAFIDDTMGAYTAVVGSVPNRVFVIRLHAGRIAADSIFDYEVLLYEGQPRFDIIYGPIHERGFSATIGVQQGLGEHYTQYSCNTQSINTGTRLTFDRRSCPSLRP
jgi:FG-GAP-like repeat